MAARIDVARRNSEIRASMEAAAVLAARHGLTTGAVSRIRAEGPRILSRRERFQLEVIEGGWRADCMDDDEWQTWLRENPHGVVDAVFADRPCRDCPATFAAEMRALDRCNGTPTGHEGEPADHSDKEDDDVIEPRLGGVRGQPQPLALSMPPCESCVHEPVCVLKHALKKVTSIEATAPALPDGLTVTLSADVDCSFYTRKKGPAKNWSPEAREAARQRAIAHPPNRHKATA